MSLFGFGYKRMSSQLCFPFSIPLLCMCTFLSNMLFSFFFFLSLYIFKFELGVSLRVSGGGSDTISLRCRVGCT